MNNESISERDIIQIKKVIIEEVFPAECDLIGETDLHKILRGPIELKHVSTGALLNFHEVYQTIASALDFLNSCLSIYINLNGLIKKEPHTQKLIEELVTKTTTTICKEDKQIIIKEVQRHIKRYA